MTYGDVKELNGISKDDKDTFILITAPKGTEIFFPSEDNLQEYQIAFNSNTDELKIFVVSNEEQLCKQDENSYL